MSYIIHPRARSFAIPRSVIIAVKDYFLAMLISCKERVDHSRKKNNGWVYLVFLYISVLAYMPIWYFWIFPRFYKPDAPQVSFFANVRAWKKIHHNMPLFSLQLGPLCWSFGSSFLCRTGIAANLVYFGDASIVYPTAWYYLLVSFFSGLKQRRGKLSQIMDSLAKWTKKIELPTTFTAKTVYVDQQKQVWAWAANSGLIQHGPDDILQGIAFKQPYK